MSTTVYLAPAPLNVTQFIPGGNVPAAGGKLFCYQAGTSQKQNMFTDNTGVPTWTNPLVLDSGGNQGGEVWIPAGLPAKFVLAPSNDTDPPASPYWSRDNISGINDPSSFQTEWVPSGLSATFVNASTFTFSGADQTGVFTTGRRLKTVNTAGTLYSTVTSSAFLTSTTTIGINSDSTGIDSGISSVNYGILNAQNQSIPAFLQNGAGAVNRTVQSKLADLMSVKDYGAKFDGTDDSTAIVNASRDAVTLSTGVFFPGFCTVTTSIVLNTSHNNLKWVSLGKGFGGIKKGFNGTLVQVNSTQQFECHSMHFNGNQAFFTGKGVVFAGSTANYPRFLNCTFEGIADSHLEFGADSGYDCRTLGSDFLLVAPQDGSTTRCLYVNGPDTGAAHRSFVDCGLDGFVQLTGALATRISNSRFFDLQQDSATQVLEVTGNSWAIQNATATLNAQVAQIVGNRIASSVVLASTATGSFVGNYQTAGTFSSHSVAAQNMQILHKNGAETFYRLGNSTMLDGDATPRRIQSYRTGSFGDLGGNVTTTVNGNASQFVIATPITTSYVITYSTSGAVDGDRVYATRQAASGGAATVTAHNKVLTASTWAMHQFDGSAWQIVASGSGV